MRKLIILLAIILVSVLVITGCSKTSTTSTTTSTATKTTVPTTTTTTPVTTASISSTTGTSQTLTWEQALADFKGKSLNTTITVTGPCVDVRAGWGTHFLCGLGKPNAEGFDFEIYDPTLSGYPGVSGSDLAVFQKAWVGQNMAVTGKMQVGTMLSNKGLEIFNILDPSQIKVLGAAATPPTSSPSASASPKPSFTPPPSVAADTTVVTLMTTPFPTAADQNTLRTDAMVIDQANHMLYLAVITPKTEIEVFDVSKPTPTFVKAITLPKDPGEMRLVVEHKKIYVPLVNGTLGVIDINPASSTYNALIDPIAIASDDELDGVEFISSLNKFYVTSLANNNVYVVDATNNKVLKKIAGVGTDRGLQPPNYNPNDGMIYIPHQSHNVIFKFDPKTDTQVAKIDIGYAGFQPTHLAIKPGSNLAVLGGNLRTDMANITNANTLIWDFTANKYASVIKNTGGTDIVIYEPTTDLFMAAQAYYVAGPCMAFFDGTGKFLTNVPTATLSRQVAYDQTNKIVYSMDTTSKKAGLLSFALPSFKK
jgi:YVTN family beta-propeller protein